MDNSFSSFPLPILQYDRVNNNITKNGVSTISLNIVENSLLTLPLPNSQ